MFSTVFLLEKPPITFILTNHDEFLNKIEAINQPIEIYTYATYTDPKVVCNMISLRENWFHYLKCRL